MVRETAALFKTLLMPSTCPPPPPAFDPIAFAREWQDLMAEVIPLLRAGLQAQSDSALGPDPMGLAPAIAAWGQHVAQNPVQWGTLQAQYWTQMGNLATQAAARFWGAPALPSAPAPALKDKRFRDPLWNDNPWFAFMRDAYMLTQQTVTDSLAAVENLEEPARQKMEFALRQYFDGIAPTNNPLTNPEVLRETFQTGGENLRRGLENLITDLKRGNGHLRITQTPMDSFVLGRDLATTPGQVVFRNHLMELIEYTPTTAQVHTTPLLIIPPWINKYYILDLRPENSLVKFALDSGQRVFLISWVNPDARYRDILFDDYLRDGVLAALTHIETTCKTKKTNALGYCIGGTLLAITLAHLAACNQEKRIASATFLTTLLDFEQAGDLKIFIDEAQINRLEQQMKHVGYLDGQMLASVFSLLRANDMVWSFVINNYMLGRAPFPFDILYWNSDPTNLPAAFHLSYLRHMYLRNDLVKPGALTINGTPIDLTRIETPCYFLSTREDHIAPWRATYVGAQLIAQKAEVTFVLAASGHVAGVVNPPAAQKYSYWVNKKIGKNADDFAQDATEQPGSWWPHWAAWLKTHAGIKIPALKQKPGLCPAPGTYVRGGTFSDK